MCGAVLPRIRSRERHNNFRKQTPPRFDINGICVLCSYDGSRLYKKCNDCFNELSSVSKVGIYMDRSFSKKKRFQSQSYDLDICLPVHYSSYRMDLKISS